MLESWRGEYVKLKSSAALDLREVYDKGREIRI